MEAAGGVGGDVAETARRSGAACVGGGVVCARGRAARARERRHGLAWVSTAA